VVDQVTKAIARAVLPLHQMVPVIGPWLGFRRTNYLPVTIPGREVLAILGGIVILICLFLVVWRGSWSQLDVVAALGAISGGAASGVFDRINPALSTQFLRVQLPLGFRIETQVSETAFVLGAAYLLLRVLTGDLPRERLGPDRPRGHSGRR
jgi:lipoprotein signal peptidase